MATAKKLPSGNYRIRVYDKATNKYKSFTAPTKREAERLGAEWLDGNAVFIDNGNHTIKDIVQEYIDERNNIVSPATIDKYQRTLDVTFCDDFKNIKVRKLNISHIKAEVNRLSAKYSPKTVKCAYLFIAPIIRKYRPDINQNDIILPKVYQKNKTYPTAKEIIDLFRGDRLELEVLLALCCGLRKEEIRGLKRSDIQGNTLTINRTIIDVKGKAVVRENIAKTVDSLRVIYDIPSYIIELANERKGEYLTELSGQAIYKSFKRKIVTLGYDITFHDLRHINASIMLFLGVPNKYAMERGGWSTDDTLKKVYQSTYDSERKRFNSMINGYFNDIYDTKHDTKNKNSRKFRIKKL